MEKAKRENDNPMGRIEGVVRTEDQTFFPDIPFDFIKFDDKDELDKYIGHKDHGRTAEKPGICFAFTVHEIEEKENFIYELELFFNDHFVTEYKSQPDQKAKAIKSYQMIPLWEDYKFYQYYGFGYL